MPQQEKIQDYLINSIIILILNIIIITMADNKVSYQTDCFKYTKKNQQYLTGITTFSLTLI